MSEKMTYREAINDAICQEMRRDNNVFVYGIGVDDHLRVFGTTKGLVEEFGPSRCFATPIAEDAMTGFGMGAALNGMRPIHIHIRVDFLLLAMNQLANMVSTHCYGTGGKLKVPMVIRAIVGRGWGQSFQHSKTMHSCFGHIPGLKVVMPTTPNDAKWLLISAIRDDNPVIVFEHRWLYDAVGEVNDGDQPIPLDQPNILRKGKDITIVATSWMNIEALQAAAVLERQGVEVEIIDARAVTPLDDTIILQSVEKTGHCLIADNDWIHCGFGAELAARVSEGCFGKLKSPVYRMGFAPTPCPCTRPLENKFYSGAEAIIRAIEKKLSIGAVDISGEDFYSHERKFKGPF